MTALVKPLAIAAAFVLAVLLIGRALDYEYATASGGLTERRGDAQETRPPETSGKAREMWDLATPRSVSPSGGIGTAVTYRDGLTKEFGNGLIRVNGHGPEWHRAKRVKAERRGDDLQRRLTRRVLQVRSLRRIVGQSFIPAHWVAILSCESGVDWTYHGSSGFHGAPQFHPGTWSSYRLPGYPAYAYQASPFQQLVVAELVLARQGWGAWPSCSRKLGLR